MSVPVTVVDYGMGNLFSVMRALEYCGGDVTFTESPDRVRTASRLVLPGVGAFADGMANLRERNLIGALMDYISAGKSFLGICLGMQLLLEGSEEFGHHRGLGVVSGEVKRLPSLRGVKLPNIGWHGLLPQESQDTSAWDGTILGGLKTDQAQYFVHSYAAYPTEASHWLSRTYYGDHVFCSTLQKGNVFACQFHPEKSGRAGLSVLEAFLHCD